MNSTDMEPQPSCSKRPHEPDTSSGNEVPERKPRLDQMTAREINILANIGSGMKQQKLCSKGLQLSCSKRPHETSLECEVGVPMQKSRISPINAQDIRTYVKDGSGVIQKVVIRNVLHHSYLEILYNHDMNVLVRRDGSRTSDILNRLLVCVGGSDGTTYYNASLKDFIKKGLCKSTIEIVFTDPKYGSFESDMCGGRIIVKRKFNLSGLSSGSKIKKLSCVVLSKELSELNWINNPFNIQVDNPTSVLNQNIAQSFLKSDSHSGKNEFTMNDLLRFVWESMMDTTEVKGRGVTSRKEQKSLNLDTKEPVSELELLWNQVKTVSDYRKIILDVQKELKWVIVDYQEHNLALVVERRIEEEAKLPPLLARMENHEQVIKEKQYELMTTEINIDNIRADSNKNEFELQEATAIVDMCTSAYVTKLQLYESLDERVEHLDTHIQSIITELDRVQMASDLHRQEQRRLIEENKAFLNQQCFEIKTALEPLNFNIQQLTNKYTMQNLILQQKQEDNALLIARVDQLEKDISYVLCDSIEELIVYGRLMPILVQKIEEAGRNGFFSRPPIGPFGTYVGVRDWAWARPIESLISSSLNGFCVDNARDSENLTRIIDSMYNGEQDRKPPVITRKFSDIIPGVHNLAVQAPPGMYTILDILIITNPIITSCLIDLHKLQNILFIPTLAEASNLMYFPYTVPLNCEFAITLDGDLVYPHPKYLVILGDMPQVNYLIDGMPKMTTNKQKELDMLKNKKHDQDMEVEYLTNAMEETLAGIAHFKNDTDRLNQRFYTLKLEHDNLDNFEEPLPPNNMGMLKAELADTNEKKYVLCLEVHQLDRETDFMRLDLDEAKYRVSALHEEGQTLMRAEVPLTAELEIIRDEINELTMEEAYTHQLVEDTQDKIERIIIQQEEQTIIMEEALEAAQQMHPRRITSAKSPADLIEEIKAIKLALENKENSCVVFGGMAQVDENKKYNRTSSNVRSVAETIAVLDMKPDKSKAMKFQAQRCGFLKVSNVFTKMLKEQQHNCKFTVDTNQVLKLISSPNFRNLYPGVCARLFSGGQCSYNSHTFVIALWKNDTTSFYYLNESDSFMDNVDNARALEILATLASSKSNCQFVLLNPEHVSTFEVMLK